MTKYEKNTKLFYDELNNNCNPEKRRDISK